MIYPFGEENNPSLVSEKYRGLKSVFALSNKDLKLSISI